jgi:hypothetical protein
MGASVHCPEGHSNPSGQKFCGQCGLPLAGLCPDGHPNPEGQKFCGECGQGVAVLPQAPLQKTPEVPQQSLFSREKAAPAPPSLPQTEPVSQTTSLAEEVTPQQTNTLESATPVADEAAPTAPPPSHSVQAIDSPIQKSTRIPVWLFDRFSSWIPVLAVIGLIVLAVIADAIDSRLSDGGTSSKPKQRSDSSSGTSSGYSGSLYDDWIPAVCQPGTYFDSSNALLPNATADATCKSARGNPILMGQFTEEFTAKNAVAMFRGAEYAVAAPATGGVVQVFLSPTAKNALAPLRSFGFVINTVPRG